MVMNEQNVQVKTIQKPGFDICRFISQNAI